MAYEPPSLEVARAEAAKLRPRLVVDGVEVPLSVRRTTNEQLGAVFGAGIQQYFKLLRWLCISTTASALTCYAVNCGLALAASADDRLSDPSGVQRLARVTLWPLQLLLDPASGAASSSFGATGAAARADKRAALLAMSLLDLAAVLSFFLTLAIFRAVEDRNARNDNLASITVDDYSLALYGLPRVPLRPEEVSEYLQAAVPELQGRVADVTIARSYGEYLERVTEAEEVEGALAEIDADVAATAKPAPPRQRAALAARLARLRAEIDAMDEAALVAVCAFVTFDTVAARDAAAEAFPGGLLRAALSILAPADVPRFRGRHLLRAVAPCVPEDVFWENIHILGAARALRALLSGLCAFTLVLITTSLVVGAKSFENTLPPYVECTTATLDTGTLPCSALFNLSAARSDADPRRVLIKQLIGVENSATCDAYISSADQYIPDLAPLAPASLASLSMARDARALRCGAAACYGCYCATTLTAYEWRSNAQGLKAFCGDYWGKKVSSWALKGVSIISVIGVNIAFLVVMPKFTRLEKLPTRGEHDAANVRKIFGAAFFNAFVVTLAVYANIAELEQFPLVFKGAYTDFSPNWYQAIGSAMFVTVCTQSVQPSAQSFLAALLYWQRHRRVAAQRTQRALNALEAGPTWQLSYRVAKVLSTTWLTLALCGGIPGAGLLLPFGLWFAYFADKWFLCHTSRRPARSQTAMIRTMRNSLVWAVWLHLALTAWMFGSPALPAYMTGGAGAPRKQNGRDAFAPRATSSATQFNVRQRLQRWPCLVQAVAFLALSVWLFVLKPHRKRLARMLRSALNIAEPAAPRDSAALMTYTAARATGRLLGVASYHILHNDAYADAVRPLFAKAQPPA